MKHIDQQHDLPLHGSYQKFRATYRRRASDSAMRASSIRRYPLRHITASTVCP
jgi:hypothetical protein